MIRLPKVLISSLVVMLAAGMFASPVAAGFAQTYQQTGNLHLEIAGTAGLGFNAMGTLTLATPPMGLIKKAYLYATQTNNTTGMSATFGGAPVGNVGPYASEALLLTLQTFRWDVTANIIPGVGSYSFAMLDGLGFPVAVAGVALVVVWDDAINEPIRTVTIVDGVKQVGENGAETESMTFMNLPAGNTSAWIFTTDDDAASGETVSYNGSSIGGPIDGNLGLNATILQMSTTSVSGSNTLSISTVSDHLTWVLGATAVDQPAVPAQKTTWGEIKSRFDEEPADE